MLRIPDVFVVVLAHKHAQLARADEEGAFSGSLAQVVGEASALLGMLNQGFELNPTGLIAAAREAAAAARNHRWARDRRPRREPALPLANSSAALEANQTDQPGQVDQKITRLKAEGEAAIEERASIQAQLQQFSSSVAWKAVARPTPSDLVDELLQLDEESEAVGARLGIRDRLRRAWEYVPRKDVVGKN